ncbi:hypothetical protein SODALDRAFT_101633 [Sodiomyces alkalinus F11]|uniref:Uncharacterized protein n=1 Tax=Sodiomyces alkalinus (strain CBS 110278 / VKM F-3762 / F11) TaxID=1314773 RepID=A0A3N2Q1T4_SODAK|nr:hypothetical protein SODALDRAFT_101633 [Sodiomyces alkalinus F11]ROT40648.1 hypothetical protein SODALDRAFT_101633 [Sodiomyces alkalinus F11]
MEAKGPAFPLGEDTRPRPWSLWSSGSTSSPRLSLNKSRRDSCSGSSTTTSSSSTWFTNPPGPISCVTRHTSRDECALHRFLVWAAVQRNACSKMSPSERLECPLLRCRKPSPDHESMLKHLYTCDLLSTGEYWCYDCGKPEKFTDRKCKRCLGHPGKRRKIIKIAKNFFTNLGLKPRKDGTPSLNQDDTALPISYLVPHPEQFELSSCGEVVELDSHEIPPALSSSYLYASATTTVQPHPQRSEQCHLVHQRLSDITSGTVVASPHSQFLDPYTGMGHLHAMPDTFLSWGLDPEVVGAGDIRGTSGNIDISAEPLEHTMYQERPTLQLNTDSLVQPTWGQQHSNCRSKKLSPQSSVRSNASISTTLSHELSPTSAFSSSWSLASGFETGLTSPTSDSASDGGFLSRGGSNASRQSRFVCETISELPADLPVAGPLSQSLPEKPCPDSQLTSTQSCPSTTPPNPPAPQNITFKHSNGPGITSHSDRPSRSSSANPESFVDSAWETLQAHVRSSIEKIRHLSHNPLACRLQSLGPAAIAKAGLTTLKAILQGQYPAVPLDILCFVHVTYALSLIIHEDDARSRAKGLFVQACLYGDRVPIGVRESYLEVAAAVWYPSDLSQTELDNMLLGRYSVTTTREGSSKGKEQALPSTKQLIDMDEFAEIARFFLDELEYVALSCKASESILVQTSALWTQHWQDSNINADAQINPGFSVTLAFVVSSLRELFPRSNRLASRLKRVQNRVGAGEIQSVRTVELELMQAGKGSLSTDEYFNRYVPNVRQHCESLYTQPLPGFVPRMIYHSHCIELMEIIISTRCTNNEPGQVGTEKAEKGDDESLDEVFTSITADLSDCSLETLLAPNLLTMTEPMIGIASTMDPLALLNSAAASQSPDAVRGEKTDEMVLNSHKSCGDTEMEMPQDTAAPSEPTEKAESSAEKVESSECCEICGFRPKGHPRWFRGSMAKHKKLQHATTPAKMYRCPFPGCTSQYRNRPDNLRQHQLDKGHFVDGEEGRRPSKRKKVEQHN